MHGRFHLLFIVGFILMGLMFIMQLLLVNNWRKKQLFSYIKIHSRANCLNFIPVIWATICLAWRFSLSG